MAALKRLPSDRDGVVYAEFIMAFTPFFLLFLGIIQLSFIAAGGLVVQAAAMKGTRAAAVILPDDRFFYDGEKEMLLDFEGNSEGGYEQALGKQMGEQDSSLTGSFGSTEQSGAGTESSSSGGPRLSAIRMAAYLPLAPLAPDFRLIATWFASGASAGMVGAGGLGVERYSLRKTGIGENAALRFLQGLLWYNKAAAAINFPVAPSAPELLNEGEDFTGQVVFQHKQPVTVRVTYLFPCTVPLVNLIVCKKIDPGSSTGFVGQIADAVDMLDALKQGDLDALRDGADEPSEEDKLLLKELRAGVQSPDLLDTMLRASSARFHVLRAETTLPLQSAAYAYPTADDYKEQDEADAKQAAKEEKP